MTQVSLMSACEAAEVALGENLVWLADTLDFRIRQGDDETINRLATLDATWKMLCLALASERQK